MFDVESITECSTYQTSHEIGYSIYPVSNVRLTPRIPPTWFIYRNWTKKTGATARLWPRASWESVLTSLYFRRGRGLWLGSCRCEGWLFMTYMRVGKWMCTLTAVMFMFMRMWCLWERFTAMTEETSGSLCAIFEGIWGLCGLCPIGRLANYLTFHGHKPRILTGVCVWASVGWYNGQIALMWSIKWCCIDIIRVLLMSMYRPLQFLLSIRAFYDCRLLKFTSEVTDFKMAPISCVRKWPQCDLAHICRCTIHMNFENSVCCCCLYKLSNDESNCCRPVLMFTRPAQLSISIVNKWPK